MDKPKLSKNLKVEDFSSFYWLKKELILLCREIGLNTTGSKVEIAKRIQQYLKTGLIDKNLNKQNKVSNPKGKEAKINLKTKITNNFKCNKENRVFFKSIIGERFRYNVDFIKFIRGKGIGKTYQEAVEEWLKIEINKKNNVSKIAPQFEYNQFIRDFFIKNKGKKLQGAIKAWKIKKDQRNSLNKL